MASISVIVPVYKVEKYLTQCIDSILNQSYTDFELILVDDGSPDHCGAICDEYQLKDGRVEVIHQRNGGLSDARNTGLNRAFENSDSEWVAFVDSDDWIHHQYLEILVKANIRNNTSLSICEFERVYGREAEEQEYLDPEICVEDTDSFFLKHNLTAVTSWGSLYRKSLFQNVRFPKGRIHEDEYAAHKILFQTGKVSYIPYALYFYYQNPAGIMNAGWNIRRTDALFALEERLLFFERTDRKELADSTRKTLEYLNLKYNLEARKAGVYKQYPKAFRLPLFYVSESLERKLGTDLYEQYMWNYYPYLVRIKALVRKVFHLQKLMPGKNQ